jgi:hypothetical protein
MDIQRRIKVQVDILTKWGNYYTQVKEFNDQKHFDNWAKLFEKNTGAKIIGSQTL